MKPPRIWVLIADGGRAKVLESVRPGIPLREVQGLAFTNDLPRSRDILADRPGRSFESVGGARHAQEYPADPHRELKRGFAGKLSRVLESRFHGNQFDELVVIAPPSFMGDLRDAWSSAVRSRISCELTRDLTKIPNDELQRYLDEALPLGSRPGAVR
jgi:protein required for attachment to host cells